MTTVDGGTWAKLRKAAVMSQHELGVASGVRRDRIADIEVGRAQFTFDERNRIVAALLPAITANLAEALNVLGSGQ